MNIEESNELVVKNMGLLVSRVLKFKTKNSHDREDIQSAGCIGLIKASRTWDKNKSKFSTYAVKCIDNAIKTFLSKQKMSKLISNKEFDIVEDSASLDLNECDTFLEIILKEKIFGFTTEQIALKYNLSKSMVENLYKQAKQKAKEEYA